MINQTALHIAANEQYIEIVKLLLEKEDLDINENDILIWYKLIAFYKLSIINFIYNLCILNKIFQLST